MKSDSILFIFVCGIVLIAFINQPHIYENSQCENVIYRLKNPCKEIGCLEIVNFILQKKVQKKG